MAQRISDEQRENCSIEGARGSFCETFLGIVPLNADPSLLHICASHHEICHPAIRSQSQYSLKESVCHFEGTPIGIGYQSSLEGLMLTLKLQHFGYLM